MAAQQTRGQPIPKMCTSYMPHIPGNDLENINITNSTQRSLS